MVLCGFTCGLQGGRFFQVLCKSVPSGEAGMVSRRACGGTPTVYPRLSFFDVLRPRKLACLAWGRSFGKLISPCVEGLFLVFWGFRRKVYQSLRFKGHRRLDNFRFTCINFQLSVCLLFRVYFFLW